MNPDNKINRRNFLKYFGALGAAAALASINGCEGKIPLGETVSIDGRVIGEHGFIYKTNNPGAVSRDELDEIPYVVEVQTDGLNYLIELKSDDNKQLGVLEKQITSGLKVRFPKRKQNYLFGGMSDMFYEKKIGNEKIMYGKLKASDIQIFNH